MSMETNYNLARVYAEDVMSLPEPPGMFLYRHADIPFQRLHQFVHHGLVECVGRVKPEPEALRIYRVNPRLYEYARDCFEKTPRFDCCGSTGVTNDDGELRCNRCGALVDEDEFRRVCKV